MEIEFEQPMKESFFSEDPNDERDVVVDETVWQSLKHANLWKLIIYVMIIGFAVPLAGIVLPQLGAAYFDKDASTDTSPSSCSEGNATFAYYRGIFSSIGGVLAFLFEGYLGRLSDVYGRKRIMCLTWFFLFSSYGFLCFTENVWVYLVLSPLSGITGVSGSSPSVLQAAFADSVPCKKNRTIVFGYLFGMGGVAVLFAAILCPIITKQFGIASVFYIFTVLMLCDLLWLIFVVDETLPPHKRRTQTPNASVKYENPCKIFVEVKHNKLLLWLSLLAIITGIPECGLHAMATNYCNDLLDLCADGVGENLTTKTDAVLSGTIGLMMLLSQLLCLPLLSRYLADIGLLLVGLCALQGMMLLGALLYFVPNIAVAVGINACFGAAYLLSPIVDGALSKRLKDDEQGIGIGVVHGMKGVTMSFSPYIFAGLYALFDGHQWLVIMPWLLGFLIVLVGFVIVLFPLKHVFRVFDEKIELQLSKN